MTKFNHELISEELHELITEKLNNTLNEVKQMNSIIDIAITRAMEQHPDNERIQQLEKELETSQITIDTIKKEYQSKLAVMQKELDEVNEQLRQKKKTNGIIIDYQLFSKLMNYLDVQKDDDSLALVDQLLRIQSNIKEPSTSKNDSKKDLKNDFKNDFKNDNENDEYQEKFNDIFKRVFSQYDLNNEPKNKGHKVIFEDLINDEHFPSSFLPIINQLMNRY